MTTATIVNIKENQELWATHQVDVLGDLLAEIDRLQSQADLIKDQLKNLGEGVRVGDNYTSEVKLYQKTTVDHKAVYAELSVPADLIAKYSKSTAVISLTVKAIKGE
jgi:hypothetical protein